MRRTPATYDRILKHIAGHSITVHCTVTRQQVNRPGLPRGVPAVLVGADPSREDLGQPLHAADRRGVGRAAAARRSRAGVADLLALRLRYPKLRDAARADRGLRRPARVARRVRLRAHDDDDLGRPDDADHAVPVRRHARLRELRLHRLGRSGRGRAAPAAGASSRSARIFTGSMKIGERMRRLRPAEPSAA